MTPAAKSRVGSRPWVSSRRSRAWPGFAYERPADAFPRLVEEAVFDARALGHPLLPEADCVRNDLRLGPEPRLLLVSGSNMSGKSTLLRSAGVNAVLALAGATVRAESLRLGVLAVGASLRAVDSLQDGTSRFYAEIKRLKGISELAGGEAPLLFLLDEILAGTNSHDRRIGAEGVIKSLLASGGLGLVTTHDLALAEIAEDLGVARGQRPLRGPPGGRQDDLRLPPARGPRREEQRPRPDARPRAGGLRRDLVSTSQHSGIRPLLPTQQPRQPPPEPPTRLGR